MNIPEWNNTGRGFGPYDPHVGYKAPGKGGRKGHIFVDIIPATRGKLQ